MDRVNLIIQELETNNRQKMKDIIKIFNELNQLNIHKVDLRDSAKYNYENYKNILQCYNDSPYLFKEELNQKLIKERLKDYQEQYNRLFKDCIDIYNERYQIKILLKEKFNENVEE